MNEYSVSVTYDGLPPCSEDQAVVQTDGLINLLEVAVGLAGVVGGRNPAGRLTVRATLTCATPWYALDCLDYAVRIRLREIIGGAADTIRFRSGEVALQELLDDE